jgi:hypothetical protein
MDNTYTPLVTDEHIERASGDPIAAQAVSAYEFGKCIGMARGMASARSTYEAERVQTHTELAELRAENERIREEVRGLSVEQAKDLLRAINAGAWERIEGALRVNAVSQEHVTQCFKDVGIELEPPF